MKTFSRFARHALLLLGMSLVPEMKATTIVSVTGPLDQTFTLGGFSQTVLAVSFTTTTAYQNVEIQASLDKPVTSYLTNQIGPGATAIATSNVTGIGDVVLFSGLTLSPGTYYLIVTGGEVNSNWYETDFPTVVTDSGVTLNPNYGAFGSTYPPALDFAGFTDFALMYTVTGEAAVPEPSSWVLMLSAAAGLSLVSWRRAWKPKDQKSRMGSVRVTIISCKH